MDACIERKVIKDINTSKKESTNELKIEIESVASQAINLMPTRVTAIVIAKRLADKFSISYFFINLIYFS